MTSRENREYFLKIFSVYFGLSLSRDDNISVNDKISRSFSFTESVATALTNKYIKNSKQERYCIENYARQQHDRDQTEIQKCNRGELFLAGWLSSVSSTWCGRNKKNVQSSQN